MKPETARRKLTELIARAAACPDLPPEVLAQVKAKQLRPLLSERQRAARKQINWRHQAAKRHASKLQRTPPWADFDQIRVFYAEAQRLTAETGIAHHVDHIIPLQGRLVSGLHVHNNMQILTGSENSSKCNRFDVADYSAHRPSSAAAQEP